MLTLRDGPIGLFVIEDDAGPVQLVQFDWDYPSAAALFGWVPCPCGATDGTIDCPHRRTGDMIWEAFEFLDSHVGANSSASLR